MLSDVVHSQVARARALRRRRARARVARPPAQRGAGRPRRRSTAPGVTLARRRRHRRHPSPRPRRRAARRRAGREGARVGRGQAARRRRSPDGAPALGVPASRRARTRRRPRFPFVCLLVSGGHTAIYRVDAPRPEAIAELGRDARRRRRARRSTRSRSCSASDTRADRSSTGSRLAGDASHVKLSPPMASRGSLEMSFSGIKTQVAQLVARSERATRPRRGWPTSAPSFQAAVTRRARAQGRRGGGPRGA